MSENLLKNAQANVVQDLMRFVRLANEELKIVQFKNDEQMKRYTARKDSVFIRNEKGCSFEFVNYLYQREYNWIPKAYMLEFENESQVRMYSSVIIFFGKWVIIPNAFRTSHTKMHKVKNRKEAFEVVAQFENKINPVTLLSVYQYTPKNKDMNISVLIKDIINIGKRIYLKRNEGGRDCSQTQLNFQQP